MEHKYEAMFISKLLLWIIIIYKVFWNFFIKYLIINIKVKYVFRKKSNVFVPT